MVIIPRNFTNDVHICGRCKIQYTLLSLFLKHKEICKENDLKESTFEQLMIKKTDVNSLIEINSIDSYNDQLKKEENQINLLNNFLIKDENQLKQCTLESSEGKFIIRL